MKLLLLLFLVSITVAQQQQQSDCLNCQSSCDATSKKCIQCDSGFFLDNSGFCGSVQPIEQCKTYDSLTRKCA